MVDIPNQTGIGTNERSSGAVYHALAGPIGACFLKTHNKWMDVERDPGVDQPPSDTLHTPARPRKRQEDEPLCQCGSQRGQEEPCCCGGRQNRDTTRQGKCQGGLMKSPEVVLPGRQGQDYATTKFLYPSVTDIQKEATIRAAHLPRRVHLRHC